MATLAADKGRTYEVDQGNLDNEVPIVANDIVYEGAAVGELNDSGTYQPLNLGATTVDKFAGFATQQCDNQTVPTGGGAAAAKNIKIRERGTIRLSVTGVTAITDVGKDVYATDDDTFTLTGTSGVTIGKIKRWESGTTCLVEFTAFRLRQAIPFSFVGQTTEAATDRQIFLANRPYYVKSVNESHAVAAGGASSLQVVKDTGTAAPGAGTDLLTNNTAAGFDLNATANTPQVGTIATTAGLRKLATGDRLSLDWANAIQSSAGIIVTGEVVPL